MAAARVAFFDLDRTLIDVNSALLWARHERRGGAISRGQLARAAAWTALYHLSLIDLDAAMREAIAHYRGVPADDLDRRTRAWFDDEVARRLRPAARAAIETHRRAGDALVILTNSSWWQARIAAERWGFDDVLANRFPADDAGRITGGLDLPLCHGAGKVVRAERWLAANGGGAMADATFYTDSYSDLPMLAKVGHPRVVCPDPRLYLAARRRGWPILAW